LTIRYYDGFVKFVCDEVDRFVTGFCYGADDVLGDKVKQSKENEEHNGDDASEADPAFGSKVVTKDEFGNGNTNDVEKEENARGNAEEAEEAQGAKGITDGGIEDGEKDINK